MEIIELRDLANLKITFERFEQPKSENISDEVNILTKRAREAETDFRRTCVFGEAILWHVLEELSEIRRTCKPETETVIKLVELEQRVEKAREQFEIGLGTGSGETGENAPLRDGESDAENED